MKPLSPETVRTLAEHFGNTFRSIDDPEVLLDLITAQIDEVGFLPPACEQYNDAGRALQSAYDEIWEGMMED